MLETVEISAEWKGDAITPSTLEVNPSVPPQGIWEPKDQERDGDPLPTHRPSYP